MALITTPRQLTQRSHFYQQIGQLTAAGVPIVNTLEMLSRSPPARSFREPIQQMLVQLSRGSTVAEAMEHTGRWLPVFDIALVRAGEHSGRLDVVCRLLAAYYNDQAALIRQMLSDLAYPVFVFHFAIFLFPVISWFQGATMTHLFLTTFGILIPLYALVFSIIYAAQGRRGAEWRSFWERVLRPIPVLGSARHELALSRLAASLEALINAGVTIIEAWELAATASGSPAIQRAVVAWKPRLANGSTPSEVVTASSQFPELFANLYHSGEISGQLDESLRRLHTYYHETGSQKLHLLGMWFPRIIYFAVALLVAYKVITIYSSLVIGPLKQILNGN